MNESNPILVRLWRNNELESLHRGSWALVSNSGDVIDGAGDPDQLIFARSATKSIQALPLVETGALDRFGLGPDSLALALASHSAEPVHLEVARDGLRRIGLTEAALQCGPQRPYGAGLSAPATAVQNNCSGKHVGFLAVSQHLGADADRYLEPDGEVQRLVRTSVAEMTGVGVDEHAVAVDGCGAPTFHLPLKSLALALARLTSPEELPHGRADAARRIVAAARLNPVLVGGSVERFCTDLLKATDGRVFPKVGAEGCYTFGVVDERVGFACKIDDGTRRAIYPLVVHVLQKHGLISDAEATALAGWTEPVRRNWAGDQVGLVEVVIGPG